MEHAEIERLLDAHTHLLTTPNVVLIDYRTKIVGGVDTGRPALRVGVVKKLSASAITSPDVVIPPTVQVDLGAGPVEIETDVVEHGILTDLNGPPIPGGRMIATQGLGRTGSLGVNITFDGNYRLLSCAHVLTAFDDAFLGRMIDYYDEYGQNPRRLTPVTGQVRVTYYPANQVPGDPQFNRRDLSWAEITTTLGAPNIEHIGVPAGIRAPQVDEEVRIFAKSSHDVQKTKVLSVTERVKTTGSASNGSKIVSFWHSVISLDPATCYFYPGDSGSAVVATSDNRVVGLLRSHGLIAVSACPILS